MGDAAAELGLSGEVEADQLTAMLTGNNPADGQPLGLRAVGGRGPVPGFDLTFSAPKSVSLLWGLGGPIAGVEVKAAHKAAVDAALGYLQQEACWTRRGANGAQFVKGNGYLAAAFEHRSSRNGDPQLHTHVLVANATKGPDGRWTRLYHPAIYEHAQTASYLYQSELRHELSRRLGVEWQEVRKGIAEIAGFSDEHLREFSTRRAEILEAVGPDASARSMEVAALTTRQAKEQGIGREELHERWLAALGERRRELPRALEGERKELERLRTQEQMRDRWGPPNDEARRERAVARQVLAERGEPALIASRLSPPPYIVNELGERPRDPEKARAWDQGVRNIETFRHVNGVTDKDRGLGSYDRHQDGRMLAEVRLRETQRRLERTQQLSRSMERSQEMSHGLDLGIGR